MSSSDFFIIFSFFACLVAGFLIVFQPNYILGVLCFILSCVFFIPVLYLPCHVYNQGNIGVDKAKDRKELLIYKLTSHLNLKRTKLCVFLVFFFCLFPVNYVLGFSKVIVPALTVAFNQLLSVVMKACFSYFCLDFHAETFKMIHQALLEETRANESKRSFMKYVLHEVRTPLNSVSMGIELLNDKDNMNDEKQEALETMKSAVTFMNDTLNGVLNMQKIEEGKFELEMAPFNMTECVVKVLNTFRGAASAKRIALSKNISNDIPLKLVGDSFRIQHIIGNLLSNAIKFSKENSSVHINVTCTSETDHSNVHEKWPITVSIVDEGVGISEENQKKLFCNFVQISPGEIQQGQGSGLGLSFIKEIVKLHGGDVSVKSKEGQGSTFSFTIPFNIISDTNDDCKTTTATAVSSRESLVPIR